MTLARSRWTSNYYISPATGSSDQLEIRCWNDNHVPADAGPPGARLGKKYCYSQKSWGGGQYVAFLFIMLHVYVYSCICIMWLCNNPSLCELVCYQIVSETETFNVDFTSL